VTDTPTDYSAHIAAELGVRAAQVASTVTLLDDGNTIPFIARYRKEATQGLDEDQLRVVDERLNYLRALDARRAAIIASIDAQGKLTPELHAQLLAAHARTELEDLYQPYKPKRRTRASIARDRGLGPLSDLILAQAASDQTAEALAAPFVTDDVPTVADALAGARDIVAETISDDPQVRRMTRDKALRYGVVRCARLDEAEDARAVYALYYDFETGVERLRPHQVLAINRGEVEKVLRVTVEIARRDWLGAVESRYRANRRSPFAKHLALAAVDGAERLLLPAIERDVRRALTERSETHAIEVFKSNLRGLLTQPPLAGHTVLGIDPGFRTGSKATVIDATGRVLVTVTIYPHEPQKRRDDALRTLAELVERHGVTLIAIGNGTASRETEALVADLIHDRPNVHYVMANEAGASVYSASPLARSELPEMDVTLRGAVSIARRIQDPLAELVKIDPKSIGVGMYQHDVDQPGLGHALDGVVESVVNQVGVDVNTASPALLTHVAGIGSKLAEKIVGHRDAHGPFPDRASLRTVSGLGPKAFEQAAGFLRVRDGANPLDASAIHPESYAVAEAVLARAGVDAGGPPSEREGPLTTLRETTPLAQLADALGTGVPTLQDIFEQLLRPGRDPRAELPPPLLRRDVLSMSDLIVGMRLNGTVRNVIDFGAFIDIGVKQDGLLHRTRMPKGTVLNVGDIIEVEIHAVEPERGRIGLVWPGALAEG
jgi:protein Tex